MRPTHSVPPDDGSRRSLRCPPSHPLMALPTHPAQASTWMAGPSGPSTHVATMGRVSPLLHQLGSRTYSPPTSATIGGGYCPTAAPPMLSAPAISSPRNGGWYGVPTHWLPVPTAPPQQNQTKTRCPGRSRLRPVDPLWCRKKKRQLMWLSGRPMLLVAEVRGSIPAKHQGWSRR
jgi:hypothetical protein